MKFILGNKILLLKIMKEQIKKIKKKKQMMKKNKMKIMMNYKINNNKFKIIKKIMMIN